MDILMFLHLILSLLIMLLLECQLTKRHPKLCLLGDLPLTGDANTAYYVTAELNNIYYGRRY